MIRRWGALFLICLGMALIFGTGSARECNIDVMRRCQRDGLDVIDAASLQANPNNINDQCRSLRENFDCIVWQTSMCLNNEAQVENKDSIEIIWRYLQSFCESQDNWHMRACFQSDDLRKCELLLSSRGSLTDGFSCRSFDSFRSCAMAHVEKECSTLDQKLLGSYLMEKGQQRAWNCPRIQNDSPSASTPLIARFDERIISKRELSHGQCIFPKEFISKMKECETHYRFTNNSGFCCYMVKCVHRKMKSSCGMEITYLEHQTCGKKTMDECAGTAMTTASFILCMLFAIVSKFGAHKL